MFQLFTLKLPSAPKSAIAADTKNRNNVNMLDRRFNIAPMMDWNESLGFSIG
jgi:hypothetical protein